MDGQADDRRSKSRHGCLTAWLVLMVVTNAGIAVFYGLTLVAMEGANVPLLVLLSAAGLANAGFAVALLRWKRWGFWGFVASTVVVFLVNLVFVSAGPAFFGLVGIAILWFALQSGTPKAWEQLD
jgi:hypothetical protein